MLTPAMQHANDEQLVANLQAETDPERQSWMLNMNEALTRGQAIADKDGSLYAALSDHAVPLNLLFNMFDAMIWKGKLEETDVEAMLQTQQRIAAQHVGADWRTSYEPLFEIAGHIGGCAGRSQVGTAFGAYVWFWGLREWMRDRGQDLETALFVGATMLNMIHFGNLQDGTGMNSDAIMSKLRDIGMIED